MKAKRWDFGTDIVTQEHGFYFFNLFFLKSVQCHEVWLIIVKAQRIAVAQVPAAMWLC